MTRCFGLAVAAGFLAGAMQLSADEAISLTVRPAVLSVRGTAQVKVLVARNDANRALVWEVDGPNFYRSSTTQLDGATARRSYLFTLRDMPAGEFDVRVTVHRNDNSKVFDRSTLKVFGGPGDTPMSGF